MRRQLACTLAVLPALVASSVHAVQQPQFRSQALAVRVDVLVTDGRNPVRGLTAADFELRDNGVPQTVNVVDVATVPLNVVLALDRSASVEGQRQAELVAAAGAVLDGLHPVDRAALVTFNHAVTPAVPLTANLRAVRQALSELKPNGRTAVLDAAYVSIATTLWQPGRSLVIVCTDAADVSSWLHAAEVSEAATRSNAVLYAVTTTDVAARNSLDAIAEATGGSSIRATSGAGLRDAFERILQEFRSRYILAYTPAGVSRVGWHRLDVRTTRRGLTVKARPGYIGLSGT